MKNKHIYLSFAISILILSGLAFMNLRFADQLKPVAGLEIGQKPGFEQILGANKCVQLKRSVINSCCSMKGSFPRVNDNYEYETKTITLTCPAPHENTSFSFECLEAEFEDEEIDRNSSRTLLSYDLSCKRARKEYSTSCGRLPNDFCPTVTTEVPRSGVALPLCSELYEYWYGPGGKDPRACNPLGTPDSSSVPPVDIIPTSGSGTGSVPPAFSSNPDGSDTSATSETDDGYSKLDIPDDINNLANRFRLEVPGNRLRYTFMIPGIRYGLGQADTQAGIDCDVNNLTCAINPFMIKSDQADRYGAFLTYLLGLEGTLANLINLSADEYTSPSSRGNSAGEVDGFKITQFIYGLGTHSSDWPEVTAYEDDETFIDNLASTWETAKSYFDAAHSTRVGWMGNLRVYPKYLSEDQPDVVRFNLRDEASFRWLNTHDPAGINGYSTSFSDEKYLDRAQALFGLDKKACDFMTELRSIIPNTSNEITTNPASGTYFTYQKPFFCRCDSYSSMKNYCIFDPHERAKSIETILKVQISVSVIHGSNTYRTKIKGEEVFEIFENNFLETYQAIALRNVFGSYENTGNYQYENETQTLTPTSVITYTVSSTTDYTNKIAELNALRGSSVIDILNYFNQGSDRRPTSSDAWAQSNITNASVIAAANTVEAFCINNNPAENPDQRQFFINGDQSNLMEYQDLKNIPTVSGPLGNYYSFSSTSVEALFKSDFNKYGCSTFTTTRRSTSSANPNSGIDTFSSTFGGEARGELDLGSYYVDVQHYLGLPGLIWVNIGTSAMLKEKSKKKWWLSVIRFIYEIILKVVSAFITFITNIATWSLNIISGFALDQVGFDLDQARISGDIVAGNARYDLEYKEEFNLKIRRLTSTIPRVEIIDYFDLTFDAPNCNLQENWKVIEGPRDFIAALFRTVVGCPLQAFQETIEFFLTPIKFFFITFVEWAFNVTTLILGEIHKLTLGDFADLEGNYAIIDQVFSGFTNSFNPNVAQTIPNPMASSPANNPTAVSIFSNLCTAGVNPDLNCLMAQLLTNPTLVDGEILGCITRTGAKTHYRSTWDIPDVVPNYLESADFPPIRYCDDGDKPNISLDNYIYNYTGVTPRLIEQLKDFNEVDVITSGGYKIGWRNQCAGFIDLKFGGAIRLLPPSSGASGVPKEEHIFELLPTKRTNWLMNEWLTCVDGYSCNLFETLVGKRAQLAACSLAGDLWYSHRPAGTTVPLTPPVSLLELLGSNDPSIVPVRNTLLATFTNVYCLATAPSGVAACIANMNASLAPINNSAQGCYTILNDEGFSLTNYPGTPNENPIDKLDLECSKIIEN